MRTEKNDTRNEAEGSEWWDNPQPVIIPLDSTLDLHTFRPQEIKSLIPEYIEACRQANIFELRIIHGKGTGALRRSVHAILERLPGVRFTPGDTQGNWGITLVFLEKG